MLQTLVGQLPDKYTFAVWVSSRQTAHGFLRKPFRDCEIEEQKVSAT